MSSRGKTWVAVSVAVALVFLVPLFFRWQAQWSLNAYRKKLITAEEVQAYESEQSKPAKPK